MATRINKVDTVSQRTAYRGLALLMGVPFALIGAFLALTGFRVWELDLDPNAPYWVIGCVGVAFGLAGLLLFVGGVRGLRNQARVKALDEPYRDYPWDPQGTRDRPFGRAIQSLLALVFYVTFLLPFHWWGWMSDEGPWLVKGMTILFDLIIVWILWRTVYTFGQALKYGHSRFRFRRFPFFLGERLEGEFFPNRFDKLKVTLRYIEERFETTSCGDNRTTRQVNLEHYKEEKTIETTTADGEVDVVFDLPAEQGWGSDISGQPVRYWELLVEAAVEGIDFRTTFLLPVYARTGRSAAAHPSRQPQA